MKTLIFLVISLITNIGIAQNFQGKAFYFSKTAIDTNFGRRQMSEDQKKAIQQRMKSVSEKTFLLTFDKNASVYKEEAKLETTGSRGNNRWRAMMAGFESNNYYKNVKDGNYVDQREFYGKNFLIKDTLFQYNWVLVNETKKIGKYNCFKAITTKKVDEITDWRSIRRKARQKREKELNPDQRKEDNSEKIELLKEIEIIAWYTPEIPISQGPGAYWGLPGLILELQEDRTTLLCNKIILNSKEKEEIRIPSKGKKVSQVDFDKITKKKVEEMIEQFSTRQRGGGPGGARRRN